MDADLAAPHGGQEWARYPSEDQDPDWRIEQVEWTDPHRN